MLPENVLPFRGRGFLGYVSHSLSSVKFCILIVALPGVGGSEAKAQSRIQCADLRVTDKPSAPKTASTPHPSAAK
jgi:hypothetical protein